METNRTNSDFKDLSFEELMDDIADKLGDDKVLEGLTILYKHYGFTPSYCNAEVVKKQLELYNRDANEGKHDGWYHLGECYAKGMGVQPDLGKAFVYYTKAAMSGHDKAMRTITMMYIYRVLDMPITNDNDSMMIEWLKKAVENKDLLAMCKLGNCFLKGKCVPQNSEEACSWYQEVAWEIEFSRNYKCKEAINYIFRRAKQGNIAAQFGLGTMFDYGLGVKQNGKKAFNLYSKVVEQGIICAKTALGRCYVQGIGVKQDFKRGVELYTEAAFNDEPVAQSELGDCYFVGLYGVRINYLLAMKWYRRALNHDGWTGDFSYDILASLTEMGYDYVDGKDSAGHDVPQNYEHAVKCFTIAAEYDWGNAQWALGDCFLYGVGTSINRIKALEYYTLAFAHMGQTIDDSLTGDNIPYNYEELFEECSSYSSDKYEKHVEVLCYLRHWTKVNGDKK